MLGYPSRLLAQFRHSGGFEQAAEQRRPDGKEPSAEFAADTAIAIEDKSKPVWLGLCQCVRLKPVQ